MKKQNGFTLVEILVVIAIIALLFGIGVPTYLLVTNNMKQKSYENKVSYALSKASAWASDTGRSVVNIGHLIEEGYMEPDNEEGAYDNPVDNSSMLCYTIRIDYNDNQYHSSLSGEEYCDYAELESQTSIIELVQMNPQGSVLGKDVWTRDDVVLRVQFKTNEDLNRYKNSIQEIIWKGNSQTERVLVNQDFSTKNQHAIQVSQFMNTRYEVTMKIVHEGKTYIYKAYTQVKIDRQNPIVYQDEINVEHYDEWKNNAKEVQIVTSDLDGSGVYGYYVNTSSATCSLNKSSYQPLNTSTIHLSLNQGEYYACVMDQVGNVSDVTKIFVDKVDRTAPTVTGYSIYQKTLNGTYYSSLSLKVGIRDADSGVSGIKYCITTSSSCNPTSIFNLDANGDIVIPITTPNKNPQKICVKGLDRAGNESALVCSNGYLFDNTPPIIQSFGFEETNHRYVVSFQANDPESSIYQYKVILKDDGDGSEKVYHSSTSGTLTLQDLPLNHRYTVKLEVINNAGLQTEAPTVHHFKTEITMKGAQDSCNISNGYCNNGVYVKYSNRLFVLYKGDAQTTYAVNADNSIPASIITSPCCDEGHCNMRDYVGSHSGIYGDPKVDGDRNYRNLVYYYNLLNNPTNYLNRVRFSIGNLTDDVLDFNNYHYSEWHGVQAYYGLLTLNEYKQIYNKSYMKDVGTLLSTVYLHCSVDPDFPPYGEAYHYLCMGDSLSGIYAINGTIKAVSAIYNEKFNTQKNGAMVLPFKNELLLSKGSGTKSDPFIVE